MSLKFFEKLSNNYLELLNDEEDFNVIINVGQYPNTKIYQAHSAILKYRSLYFRNELANTNKDGNNIKTVNLKNVTIQQFEIIIKYIYGGIFSSENLEPSFILELILIIYEFLLEELAKNLEIYLIETQASWLRLHFSHVYKVSFQHNKLQELQKWCNNILIKYPDMIFNSEDFKSIPENALISLIGRDDLQMDEVKIWNRVIEWGIAQNSDLPSDHKNWAHDDFLALKTTLQNILPLIRYFQISGDDIIDNLQPYQQILDKNLWDEIMKRLVSPSKPILSEILPPRIVLTSTLPTRVTEPFSKVLNETHADEIASWIDRKSIIYSTANNPYEFKLLLRGSRDGFTKDSFWNLCDKKTHLVVVMKVKGTDEILGGYNPIGWEKSSSDGVAKYCNDSFIFSLKNRTIQNSILSRVKKPGCAIECDYDYGPIFGGAPCSLVMYDNFDQDATCWCFHSANEQSLSYEKRIKNPATFDIGYSYFSVDEYEIFQISKKL